MIAERAADLIRGRPPLDAVAPHRRPLPQVRVAIVGAGFSGIAMAIALRREGIEDFTVFERADDLGGVWHHNTYPGAACDVPSYLYSYSYEQRRDWSQPCSPQEEILDYLHDTARKHGVIDRVRTGTEVERADFDDAQRRAGRCAPRRASASRRTRWCSPAGS